MTIHSTLLGSVTVSGDEAQALTRKLTHGRGTKAASAAADNGRTLVASYTQKGAVSIKLGSRKFDRLDIDAATSI